MPAIQQEPIAIIGMGCRFPQAHNLQAFWTLLCEGKDAIREVPANRWNIEKVYHSDATVPGKTTSRWGGFLDQVDQFDWRAFRTPPNEATSMDPQQRLLLEVCWEALEDAGLPFEEVAGSRTSVSIGIGGNDYLRLQARNWTQLDEHSAVGNANGFAANRLSYFFDLKGPSVAVDSGCASSLTAVYLACQSLWSGEASLALAGGVNLMLSPEGMIMESKARLLSGEGRCKTLDATADGYVRGEGAGMLVLKSLSQVKPSDRVYALIRGIAFNHNGHSTWITAPNQTAQETLLRDAYYKAGVSPWQIDYVELHGTGFLRGDAVEAHALGTVLGDGPERTRPCLVGSVKTNIGHLGVASGIASVIKVALSLYHREIPPTLNLQTINPQIPLDDLHLAVSQTCTPWPEKAGVPLAGVTALSFSGANAHAVLSAYSSTVEETSQGGDEGDTQQVYRLLPLSARSEEALYALAKAYEDFLQTQVSHTASSWRDICYTASVRRTHHRHRLAVLGRTAQEATEALRFAIQQQFSSDHMHENIAEPQNTIPIYLADLKELYTSGHEVNWSELYRKEECHCVSLPLYCWQRERLWPAWLDVEEISTPPEQSGSRPPSECDSPPQLAATALEDQQSLLNQLRLALPQQRPEILRTALTKQVQELLGLDDKQAFGPQQGLFELGMGSLTATSFVNQLQAQLGCSLSLILLFSYPTIESLVNYLLKDVLALPVLEPATMPELVPTLQQSESQRSREPIAIIGMGCRFPGGVHTPEDFWRLLCDEVDTVSDIPAERWDVDAFYDADPLVPGKMYTRKGSFLADIDKFDPMFFRISPREARGMDPQQRLLLEVGWEALEDAGQANSRLAGSQTGVLMGIMSQDYARRYERGGDLRLIDAYYSTGNDFGFAPGRLSYTFGLQGPSIAIDTTCSSSLVAVHLACQSLRTGECDMALAGGVSLILSPELNIFLSKAGAMAPDGRSKTFDESADGMGRGEGCGVVVLKRLSTALADGDRILALIQGSAVNHGGSSGGLTVPNGQAQQALLRRALLNAQVASSDVSYIEAHGTGTILGDPIEIQALNTVLSEGRALDQPVVVGSVKANIGHLDAAAGIAGLIKVVLMLQHAEIPRHPYLKQLNTRIPWSAIPLVVPTERRPWLTNNGRHLAGVSSFGMSGTNAHVVVGEAPELPVKAVTMQLPEREYHILALSAHTETALRRLAGRHAAWLAAHPQASLADVAYTLGIGRAHLDERVALVVESVPQAQQLLSQLEQGDVSGLWRGCHESKPKVAWVFTGEGSQYVGMGRELYERLPVVCEVLDHCAELLGSDPGLLEVLFTEQEGLLDHPRYMQPALFALEVALAQQLRNWGLEPDVVLGYRLGQYCAAVVAGVLSLEDGLRLIAKRGELMEALPTGEASALPESALEEFESFAKEVPFQQANKTLICNLTGEVLASGQVLDAGYWRRHSQEPVQFARSLRTVAELGVGVIVDVGPQPALSAMVAQGWPEGKPHPALVPTLRPGYSEVRQLAEMMAQLYVQGITPNFGAWDQPWYRSKLALPTYPFQRRSYYLDR